MWSVIQPERDVFNWTVLDKTFELAQKYGLKVVLGTPTATPPKWLIDAHGSVHDNKVLPRGSNMLPRKFGSRRHYSFSSDVYRRESAEITRRLAQRYGKHEALAGWQTDNEYGCHSTTRSYDDNALLHFRRWLAKKYDNNIHKLNEAWGQVFWSAHYNSFESIDLPHQTVTEAFPSQWLDFYRFSSEQVSSFNKLQVDIIRQYSPNRFITHNFMGFFFEFDHYDLAKSGLDFVSWDSYPLGFTDEQNFFSQEEKAEYFRTGHPDIPSFNHDLYSGVTGQVQDAVKPEFWVMEQQPGPVNWAFNNPSPAKGMVRLWTWDAISHGASVVSYFRWRQAPFAQEQMHAGLNLPNYQRDQAYYEAKQVLEEIEKIKQHFTPTKKSPVALIFDYQTQWVTEVQPQGRQFNYAQMSFYMYSKLRELGLDVDILRPGSKLDGYKFVVVPSLPIISDAALRSFESYLRSDKGIIIFGPRSGSKTENLSIPSDLPPGSLQKLFPIKVTRVESFGANAKLEKVSFNGKNETYSAWREYIETDSVKILGKFTNDDRGAVYSNDRIHYLAFYPQNDFLENYYKFVCKEVDIPCEKLPRNVRIQKSRGLTFIFNFNSYSIETPVAPGGQFLVGGKTTDAYGVSVYKQ